MAYYGGTQTPAQHVFPASQPAPGGQGNSHTFGNQGPSSHYPEMFHHQRGPPPVHFNEYDGNNSMSTTYMQQQQEYYGHGQTYNSNVFDPAQNPGHQSYMMQTGKQSQGDRGEPMKILRNPFPTVSNEIVQKSNESYDPSFPTGPSDRFGPPAATGHFNQHQRVVPPPPSISNISSSASSMSTTVPPYVGVASLAPMYNSGPGLLQDSSYNMYGNGQVQQQSAAVNSTTVNSQQSYPLVMPRGNSNDSINSQQIQAELKKMHVMTGLVTQIQPGSFGMVSEEIFFQEGVVSGPLPKVGDKVVVEAEAVTGMPFKFNAKRVTRLDMDLVNAEKTTAPTNPQLQNQIQRHQGPQPNFHCVEPPQNYLRVPPDDQNFSRLDPPNFGPLPSLPDSLNLPRPVPPPNLASVLPSSSDSQTPLKSILKRRGSPSLKRNPPPPPLISKNAGKHDIFKPSAPSSLKQNTFLVNLVERNAPSVHLPQERGPKIDFPEFTFFNREKPKVSSPRPPTSPRITRLLPRSPVPEFVDRRSSSVDVFNRGHRRERTRSPEHISCHRRRSRSKSPKNSNTHRSKSRSVSPRRSHRSRSRSISPGRTRSVSPRRSRRSRSRSPSSNRRRTRYSRTPSPRRRRSSRSYSPKNRRRVSRSTSRDKPMDSRRGRSYRSRRSSRSRSTSPPFRTSEDNRSRSQSPGATGLKVFEETVTNGIVVKRVSSDLFPKVLNRTPDTNDMEIIRRDGIGKAVSKPTAPQPPAVVPIKFQITNQAKATPIPASSIVPNPTFKATTNMNSSTLVQNPAYNLTKTVLNPLAQTKVKKKKPREQEPAFRVLGCDTEFQQQQANPPAKAVLEDKIKHWEDERQNLKSKAAENLSSDKLLKNPVNILHLKQTIQNDLQELRVKGKSDTGKKLLENPIDIEKLKQTVQKDLQELKNKESSLSTISGAKDTSGGEPNTPVLSKSFDENVEKRLRDLRSKFENHIKDAKASLPATSNKSAVGATNSSGDISRRVDTTKQTVTLVVNNPKEKSIPILGPRTPRNSYSETSSGRSRVGRPSNIYESPPPIELVPYDEQMEKLQEEIHQQRFIEEEHRLKSVGDRVGLEQLYYMEDRRRRRMDERHLARIRMTEIQLKKDKKFGDLAGLREEWGPPAKRLEQERELRQIRMNEEHHENQLQGQAEAIKRQEFEYQRWLEEEAAARKRSMQETARASRGCEGRVLRRRTPSPSSLNKHQPRYVQHGPPSEPPGAHPLRRRSRSPSFERYKQDWHRRRHPRDRSPPMNYEQFVVRYPIGPPVHSLNPDMYPSDHHDLPGPVPTTRNMEHEGFFVSRLDDVNRRQDELLQREREIQQRMEMAQRRIGGSGPLQHHSHQRGGRDDGREEIRRYAVPRR